MLARPHGQGELGRRIIAGQTFYTGAMLRLTRAPNIAVAALWADALRQAGFSASVQRYFLGGIAGEIPPEECLPEVWLAHDDEKPRAQALLEALQNTPQRRWLCRYCGEMVEGGFEQCWHCGAAMPVAPA